MTEAAACVTQAAVSVTEAAVSFTEAVVCAVVCFGQTARVRFGTGVGQESQRARCDRPGPGFSNLPTKGKALSVGDRARLSLSLGWFGGQCKGNRRGGRYEGHAGARFDPTSAPLGARASRRIEQGKRFAPTFFRHG